MSHHRWSRPLRRVVTAAAGAMTSAAVLTAVVPSVPAYADTASMESQFVALTNGARQSAGLAAYSVSWDLVAVARRHSQQMAASDTLYHNPGLTTDITGWQAVGENVGTGPTVDAIQVAFMNSPEHRANILDRDFTQIGVGVVVDGSGRIWVTEDFREPVTVAATTARSAPRPVSTLSAATRSRGGATPAHASAGRSPRGTTATASSPARLARERLLARLAKVRAQRAAAHVGDPVAQALEFALVMRSLAG